MRIYIKDIKAGGSVFQGEVAAEVIGSSEYSDLGFEGPLKVEAKVEKVGGNVLSQTRVAGRLKANCSRCMDDIFKEWNADFMLDYEVTRNSDYIELEEDIRQEVVTRFPGRLLCDDNCLGLCPKCGINKNKDKCDCEA